MIALLQDYYHDPLMKIVDRDTVFGNSITIDSCSHDSGDKVFKTFKTDRKEGRASQYFKLNKSYAE